MYLQTSVASSLSFGDVLDVRVLKTYDIVVHVRRMVVTSTGVRVSMAVGGTAAVDWVRLLRPVSSLDTLQRQSW